MRTMWTFLQVRARGERTPSTRTHGVVVVVVVIVVVVDKCHKLAE